MHSKVHDDWFTIDKLGDFIHKGCTHKTLEIPKFMVYCK